MRHNINKFLCVSFVACVLIGSLFLSSCEKDQVDLTSVQLNVFGPSPALRGGELKFIGTNMDKVTAVILPQNVEVTTFVSKTSTELVIAIPQNTVPGVVTLKTADGDIKTKTPLTFAEPISMDTYTTTSVKAGDLFTITGDYLNNIAEVVFSEGAVVDSSDFVSQTRYKIEVYVHKAAKTGKVAISNGAEMPILVYSAGEVTITNPTTLAAITPAIVKPGQNVKIAGTNLNLVKSVILPDGNKIDSAEISLNAAFTEITVKAPLTVKEGVIKVITYSGVEISTAGTLKLVAPAITALSPALVKNGTEITITGTNLDLVTGVDFATIVSGTIVSGTIAEQSETSIKVLVPMTAYDGEVVLNSNSGLTAKSSPITMIQPTIASLSTLALTAGDTITITGANLDLVRKVSFSGGSIQITPVADVTSLIIAVPMTCSGIAVVKLTTVNGIEVESTDQLNIKAATTPAISEITASVAPGGLMTILGKNLNFVESIYFGDVKAVLYGVRSESSIQVYVPVTATGGKIRFTMKSYVGEEIISPEFLYGTDPVVDASYVFFDFDKKGSWWGSYGAVENNTDLSISGKYFRINADLPAGWVDFFWRNGQNDLKVEGVTVAQWAVKMDVNVLGATTQAFKFRLNGTDGDFWAIIPGFENKGGWYTVTIPLTNFKNGDGYGTTILPNVQNITKDFGLATAGVAGFVNMCIDNIRFEKISGAAAAPKFKLIGF